MPSPALLLITGGALLAGAAGVRSALTPASDLAAPLLLATATGLLLAGLFMLGEGRRRGRFLAALIAGGGVGGALMGVTLVHGGVLHLGGGEDLVLGLPAGAALVVYGLGLIPVFVFPALYAFTEVDSHDAGAGERIP